MGRLTLFKSQKGYWVFPYRVIPDRECPGFHIKYQETDYTERWLVCAGPKVKSFSFVDINDRKLTAHCDKDGSIKLITVFGDSAVVEEDVEIRNNHGNAFWGHAYRVKKVPL